MLRHGADAAGGFQPVHLRHLHIHQYQVVVALAHPLDGGRTVFDDIDDEQAVFEQRDDDLAVDPIVLGEQYVAPGKVVAQQFVGRIVDTAGTAWRCRFTGAQEGGEPEAAAAPRGTVATGVATHQLSQPPGDDQPEPGAAMQPGGRIVDLVEGLEQLGLRLGRQARPAVDDFEADQVAGLAARHLMATQVDAAALGELDSIAQVIEQRLAQAHGIAEQDGRQITEFVAQSQALAVRLVSHDLKDTAA